MAACISSPRMPTVNERSECEPARAKPVINERSECEPARAKPVTNERSECEPARAKPVTNEQTGGVHAFIRVYQNHCCGCRAVPPSSSRCCAGVFANSAYQQRSTEVGWRHA